MRPLPVFVDVALMAVASCLGVAYGASLFRRGARLTAKANAREFPLLAALGLAFASCNIVFPLVWDRPLLAWYLPLPFQYWYLPVICSANAAVLAFLSGAVGALAHLQRKAMRWVVPIVGVVVLAASAYLTRTSHWLRPANIGEPRTSRDGVVLQTDYATCAAAACANIARRCGIDIEERGMADLLGTTADGTTVAQIVYGMERLGFRCVKRRIPAADVMQLRAPAVLLVAFADVPLGHAVAYMGGRDGKAEIWNPSSGKEFLSPEQLRTKWQGHAIEVLDNPQGARERP